MCRYNKFSPHGPVVLVLIIMVGLIFEVGTIIGEDGYATTATNSESLVSHASEVKKAKQVSKDGASSHKLGWISHILSEKLSNFRPQSRVNGLCNQQSDLYEKSLQNLTLWAVQMKEASGGSTDGMLVGQRFQASHYDECLAIQTPSITGRYCLVGIKFAPTSESYPEFYANRLQGENAPLDSKAWDTFKKSENPYRLDRNFILRGICVPAACSRQDVEESLEMTFADVEQKFGISLNLTTDDLLCSSSIDDEPLPLSTRLTLYGLVFLSTLAILVSFYHFSLDDCSRDVKKGGLGRMMMMSFSIENNWRSLTEGTATQNLNALDWLRFCSTVQTVIEHRLIYLPFIPFNPSVPESMLNSHQPMLFMSTLVFDTFFIISGFLLFINRYLPLKTHGITTFPSLLFDRWLRLMPSLLTLIVFMTFLLPHMGNGPLWKYLTHQPVQSCRHTWWTYILGLNNFFGYDLQDLSVPCAFHAWYVACDLQMFLVGALVVYMLATNESLGLTFALAVFAASILIPFSIIYFNNIDGVLKFDPSLYPNGLNFDHLDQIYSKSYTRAGPFILSIIAAFLFMKIQQNKWTLSLPMRWCILLIAIAVGVGSQFFGFALYDADRQYNALENALFGAVHRSLWALMICTFIVIQLAWGLGGKIDRLLTHPTYVPLSRLGYLVYLFHPFWQFLTAAQSRTPVFWSFCHAVWMVVGDLGVVYLGSLWLYFIIEGPASKIRNALRSKIEQKGRLEEVSKLD